MSKRSAIAACSLETWLLLVGEGQELGLGLPVRLPIADPRVGSRKCRRICIYSYLLLLGAQRSGGAVLFFPPCCRFQMRPGAVRGCPHWGKAVGTTRVTGAGAALASGERVAYM